MPDASQVQPVAFNCEGGLVLNRSTFMMKAGEALELQNFEPDVEGGYRRINGFRKYINHELPHSSSSTESVLLSATFGNNVIAARGTVVYSSASTELASAIASDTTMSGSGTITVDSTSGFSSTGTIKINSEIFTYTGKTSTTLTGVTRAYSSTTAAAHGIDAIVSESWTSKATGRTSAVKYNFERYNFDGTDKFIAVSGASLDPIIFNSSLSVSTINSTTNAASGASTTLTEEIASDTTMTSAGGTIKVASVADFESSGSIIIGNEEFTYTGKTNNTFTGVTRATSDTGAVKHTAGSVVIDTFPPAVRGAKFVAAFKEHMFYAGMSANPQEVVYSVLGDETSFSIALGAGSFNVDDTITGLKVFRDGLFIFCENRIFKLSGTSFADFAVVPVTRNIGCINGSTIQEFAGDLMFLGPDGLRTVAGTARIGDVELGAISANVQSIFNANLDDASKFESVVIPDKTQYRIFFTKEQTTQSSTKGIICVMKGGNAFEFSELKGIRPACTDTFVRQGDVIVLHGSYNSGYIYRQEYGNTFDGTSIMGRYRSPDLTFNDAGIRKHMQKVLINYKPESTIDADLFLRYDYEDPDIINPSAYALDSSDVASIYGTDTYAKITDTTTAEALDDSETAVDLTSATGFASSGVVYIEDEQITYTGISSNTLTGCTRGANGTTAAAHDNGTTIWQFDATVTDTEATYGGVTQPLVRQAVEGSGFAVALRINDGGETAPYSIKGFQLEYQTGARR